jgi:translation initiation factor IF-1
MSDPNREDRMSLDGVVVETNKGIFKVQINESHIVTARLSGRIKLNEIKVIVGDRVTVEVSPYDMSLGRIVKRMKL